MRALISFITRSAISRSRSVSSRPARNLADSPIDRSHTSEMLRSSIGDGQRRRLQPGAAARRARHLAHVALDTARGSSRSRRRCGGAGATG